MLLSLQYKGMADASADGFMSYNGSTKKWIERGGKIKRRKATTMPHVV